MPTTGTMRYLTIGDSTYEVYNTDTEVIQTYVSASGYTNWRPLVVGYSSNSSETTAPTTTTGTTYTFNTIKVKPSDGIIRFGAAALYNGSYTTTLSADTLTAARTVTVPDKSGVMALTSDIPDVSGYAPLASPTFTGIPTAPTPGQSAGDTEIATVKYVQDAVSGAGTGTGTVTSVGLSNATNGGLSISGSPITSSGSITVGHTNVLTSAQTTQAVYPIKIDKNGHISAYGAAVSIPTKTSDLINDSGFITSYTETDPVFSASAAAGITSTDISNWNALISDDHKWNDVSLNKSSVSESSRNTVYVPLLISTSSTTAYLMAATYSPSAGYIPRYDASSYLYATTPSANDNSTKVATTAYVDSAITALPEPMIFKGSLGTGGTITSLPAASSSNEGFTYKVITAGTYASQSAKIGDTFISDGSSWVLIPSGDEPSGTVTSITAGVGLTTADGNPITSSGTIKTKLNSETSLGTIGSTSKLYAVGVDSNGQFGVKVPWANDQVYTIKSSSSYVDMFLTGSTSSDTSTGYLYKDPSARLKVSDSSGETGLFLGDDITEGEKLGAIYLYSQSGIYTRLTALATTMVKYISLPDKTGIIALTDDIPSISLNGSSTTSASFYAPTTAGTSGYYLKSNGSGAPTWTAAPTIPSNNVTGSGSINYLPRWSGTNTLSSTSLYISTSYNSSSDLYGTIQLCVGSTGQIDWRGQLVFHDGSVSKTITITPPSLTASRALTLPDKTGTIALTSDVPSISLNGSSTTSASFYAPTSAGTLGQVLTSNGSGAPTWAAASGGTDEKLAVAAVTSGTTYYPIVGTGTAAATRQFDTTGFSYSANSIRSFITLGNNISEGTTGSKRGAIQIYGTADRYTQLETLITSTGAGQNTGVVVYFPDKGGTVALTSDIPTVPTISLNGSSTASASFYAPTTAGTSGQVLTSSGSGMPSWTNLSASDIGALPDTTTIPSKTSDLQNDSGFITGMTILSYGSSTWQNFIDAYDANKVVYCRASSNSNPASGSQTRLAFMAYVNNATTPTEVEFQYYRSVSTHTASQQGDQVYVYKFNKTNGWSVTVREASVKVVAGTGLGGTYSNGTMTLTGPTISLNGSSTTSASFYAPTTAGTSGQVLTSNGSGAPTWSAITVPTKTSDLTNDSGFITSSTLPTSLSDLTNDMNVSDFPNDAGYSTQTIYASTTAPTSSDGSNGDIWLVYEISSES